MSTETTKTATTTATKSAVEMVNVIGLGFNETLHPTKFDFETITLNDFFSVIQDKIPATKKEVNFKVNYKDLKVTLQAKKSDLTKEMKTQILMKFPILKDFEAKGKEIGKPLLNKFVSDCVKNLSQTNLYNMLILIDILSNKKDIFKEVDGFQDICQRFATSALESLESLKTEK